MLGPDSETHHSKTPTLQYANCLSKEVPCLKIYEDFLLIWKTWAS